MGNLLDKLQTIEQRRQEVQRLVGQGYSVPEIAAKLGYTKSSLYNDLHALHLSPPPKQRVIQASGRALQIAELKTAGYTTKEIAAKLGITVQGVYSTMHMQKLKEAKAAGQQDKPVHATTHPTLASPAVDTNNHNHAEDALIAFAAGHTKAWLEQYARSVGIAESALMPKVGLMISGRGR